MAKNITKEYSNGEVTVVWKPNLCIHSEKCFNGLPAVFNPNNRPWINANGASTEKIVGQVKNCPSGALSYFYNSEEKNPKTDEEKNDKAVEFQENGPIMMNGPVTIKTAKGEEKIDRPKVFFCRCGQSGNKPFCDGSHKKSEFVG